MRLDRYVASVTAHSRRDVGKLVRFGRIRIDGVEIRDRGAAVPAGATVTVDGVRIDAPGPLTLMLHKPLGVISATTDELHETVIDLLPDYWRSRKLSPVGRLDKETTGLLLLTSEGPLVQRFTHPKRHLARVYEATLTGPMDADAEARFAEGVVLRDETICRPAELVRPTPDALIVKVTVHEGKYHQVRRMVGACGSRVSALHRTDIGPLPLDPELARGSARVLRADELQILMDATERPTS